MKHDFCFLKLIPGQQSSFRICVYVKTKKKKNVLCAEDECSSVLVVICRGDVETRADGSV